MSRKSVIIKDQKELDYYLHLTPKECQKTSVFMDTFGNFNGKVKHNTYDIQMYQDAIYL